MNSDPSELDVRTKVKENAIQTFSDIFVSSQLNAKNKIQLSNHLLLHAKRVEETMQINKKSKKHKAAGISKERKIAKLVSISSAVYMIALAFTNKKTKEIDQTVFGNLESILRICFCIKNEYLNRICSEGLALLYKQLTTPEYMTSIVEVSMKTLHEEIESKGMQIFKNKFLTIDIIKSSPNIQRHAMLLGNILRYNELEDNQDLMEALKSAFLDILKLTNF